MKAHKRHKISYMGKRMVMLVVMVLFLTSPKEIDRADAQVFIMSDEEFSNTERVVVPSGGLVPIAPQDLEEDWIYSPVGDGLFVLAALGGAYLLKKGARKKHSPNA